MNHRLRRHERAQRTAGFRTAMRKVDAKIDSARSAPR